MQVHFPANASQLRSGSDSATVMLILTWLEVESSTPCCLKGRGWALRPLPIHCLSNKPGNAHRKMLTCGFCFVGCLLCNTIDSSQAPFVTQKSRRVACHHHLGSDLMSYFFLLFYHPPLYPLLTPGDVKQDKQAGKLH